MNLNHNIPLASYPNAIIAQRSHGVRVELLTSDYELIDERAGKYYKEYLQIRIRYGLYRIDPLPEIKHWRFKSYLHGVNKDALFSEVIEKALSLEPLQSLEYIIEAEVEKAFNLDTVLSAYRRTLSYEDEFEVEDGEFDSLIEEFEEGEKFWNYDPESTELWTDSTDESGICTDVQMSDTIQDIADRLRQKIVERQGKTISPDWEEKPGCDAGCVPVTSNEELLRLLGF